MLIKNPKSKYVSIWNDKGKAPERGPFDVYALSERRGSTQYILDLTVWTDTQSF